MGGFIMDFVEVEECSVVALRSSVIMTNAGAHTHANDVNTVD
jgi:hypothetical protein